MKATYIAAALLLTFVSGAAAQRRPATAEKTAPQPTIEVGRAFGQEQMAWFAVQRGDVAAFNKLVAPPFTYIDAAGITAWDATTTQRLKDCTTTGFQTSQVHTQQPGDDIVILSYKAEMNQVCKGVKSPQPIYVLSVWQRQGNSWKLVAHSESHGHVEP